MPVDRRFGGESRTLHLQTDHSFKFLNPWALKCRDNGLAHIFGGIVRKSVRALDLEPEIGWQRHLKRICRSFKSGDFDVILATGGPFLSFKVAMDLSERISCPFVVDYRDLWTGTVVTRSHGKRVERREKAILRACQSAIADSPDIS